MVTARKCSRIKAPERNASVDNRIGNHLNKEGKTEREREGEEEERLSLGLDFLSSDFRPSRTGPQQRSSRLATSHAPLSKGPNPRGERTVVRPWLT
jgi:hypothetical protein